MGRILVLGGKAVRDMLSMADCISVLRRAMVSAISPEARQPPRVFMPLPDGKSIFGLMPGSLPDPACFGAKLISVFPGNFDQGLPSHQGGILLFEPVHGRPVAFIDANEVTAIRTAAASAVATDLLARPDATVLSILGYGEQAERHLESMALVRALTEIRVWGRSAERAQAFAARIGRKVIAVETAQEAILGADIVCTTTASHEPIVMGSWLRPGMHLNLVGASAPTSREVDDEAVARSRFFVDMKVSAVVQAGEYLSALAAGVIDEGHILGQLGELIDGRVAGRKTSEDITIYKSLGVSAQDLACASFLFDRARETGQGDWVAF